MAKYKLTKISYSDVVSSWNGAQFIQAYYSFLIPYNNNILLGCSVSCVIPQDWCVVLLGQNNHNLINTLLMLVGCIWIIDRRKLCCKISKSWNTASKVFSSWIFCGMKVWCILMLVHLSYSLHLVSMQFSTKKYIFIMFWILFQN